MPRKIQDITRATLEAVPLPVHAATYTVISHKSIMDYALAEIAAMGFTVHSEEYRATHDGQIAQGIYQLNYNSDPEMSLMFAWTNSYNKQIRFKCAVGGYVHANQTVMLCGEIGTYARKHTGTADADTIAMMQTHLSNAKMYYDNLVADKEEMKLIPLSSRKQAEILGVLFAEYEILTTEQASIIRQQMDKPSFFYNGGKDTLWSFYNHATVALQQSHPRPWMEDQRMLHWFIGNEFNLGQLRTAPATAVEITVPMVDPLNAIPNQTNILDQIAEIEAEETIPSEISEAMMNAPEVDFATIDPSVVTWFDKVETVDEDGETQVTFKEVEPDVVQYTDPAGNTFEAIDFHNAVTAEEEVVDIIEAEKNLLTEDELAHQLYGVDNDIEVSIPSVDLDAEEDEDWNQLEAEGTITPERVKFSVDDTEETTTEFDFDLNFEDEEEGDSNQFFL